MMISLQNCSNSFKSSADKAVASSDSLLAAPIINLNATPDLVNSAAVNLGFEVTGSAITSVSCQLNGGVSQDCSSNL